MRLSMRNSALALVLGLGVVALGGCQNKEQEARLEQLSAEHAQMAADRDQQAKDAEAARASAAQLQADNQRLMAEVAARPAQPMQTTQQDWTNGNSNGGGNTYQPPAQQVVIEMAGDVAFAPGQATLSSAGKKELDGIARKLNGQYSSNFIRVEGYTDIDPPNKSKKQFPTNEALSQARAESVTKYLSTKGVGSSRMEAIGRGAANAKATKAASRRVEIHILGS